MNVQARKSYVAPRCVFEETFLTNVIMVGSFGNESVGDEISVELISMED